MFLSPRATMDSLRKKGFDFEAVAKRNARPSRTVTWWDEEHGLMAEEFLTDERIKAGQWRLLPPEVRLKVPRGLWPEDP